MTQQKTVALDVETYEALLQMLGELQQRVSQQPDRYPVWLRGRRISVARLISWLVRHDGKDRERKRRFDAKRQRFQEEARNGPCAFTDESDTVSVPEDQP